MCVVAPTSQIGKKVMVGMRKTQAEREAEMEQIESLTIRTQQVVCVGVKCEESEVEASDVKASVIG